MDCSSSLLVYFFQYEVERLTSHRATSLIFADHSQSINQESFRHLRFQRITVMAVYFHVVVTTLAVHIQLAKAGNYTSYLVKQNFFPQITGRISGCSFIHLIQFPSSRFFSALFIFITFSRFEATIEYVKAFSQGACYGGMMSPTLIAQVTHIIKVRLIIVFGIHFN